MRKYLDFYMISLWILCIAGLMIFLGHYSSVLIDVGREVYYPEQILQGKVLYKDIFNIYGALAYQINAVLYFIFGAKLSTLYFAGCVSSMLAVSGIYILSREFLPKISSFTVGLFTLSAGVCTTSIFNFHFPYSWAVLYGLISFLYSVFFLVRFEKTKNTKYLILSAFLGGACVAFKYDFLLYSFVILYFVVKNKNLKAFLSFVSVPLISYFVLFVQGLRFNDIINTLSIYGAMAKSQTLKYFYQNSGIYFHKKSLPTDVMLFVKLFIPFILTFLTLKSFSKKPVLKYLSLIFTTILMCFWFNSAKYYILGFLPILLLILFITAFKEFKPAQKILAVSALLVSVKVFWVLLLNSYGSYYAPILILAVLVLLLNCRLNINVLKTAVYFVLFVSLGLVLTNLQIAKSKNYEIKSEKGRIYTAQKEAESTSELINYLQNAPKGDVLIFPEGLTVNFLADKKSDDFYNSLLPLYVETFGEKDIINRLKTTKPKYVILNNLDMKDYYFRFICKDYALDFCGFVNENYELDTIFGDDFRYLVFRAVDIK